MKIVISAGSVIWNENHPALKKYGDDCLAFRHGPAEELLAAIGDDRDVLVLTDNDPASFELYDMLASSFHSRRIHLFACLPFSYESSRRKREIRAHLGNLEMARSLCLVELDGFLSGSSTGETLGSLQLRIRNDMIVLLEQAISAMRGLDEFRQYRYDPESSGYRPSDLSLLAEDPALNVLQEKQSRGKSGKDPCGNAGAEPAAEPEENGRKTGFREKEPEENRTAGTEPAEEINAGKGPASDTGKAAESADQEERIPEETQKETFSPESIQTEDLFTEPPAKHRRSLFSFLRRKKD